VHEYQVDNTEDEARIRSKTSERGIDRCETELVSVSKTFNNDFLVWIEVARQPTKTRRENINAKNATKKRKGPETQKRRDEKEMGSGTEETGIEMTERDTETGQKKGTGTGTTERRTRVRKEIGKGIEKEIGKGIEKERGKGIEKEIGKGIEKESGKGIEKESGKGIEKESGKGIEKGTETAARRTGKGKRSGSIGEHNRLCAIQVRLVYVQRARRPQAQGQRTSTVTGRRRSAHSGSTGTRSREYHYGQWLAVRSEHVHLEL
jgi:hypothetical protein